MNDTHLIGVALLAFVPLLAVIYALTRPNPIEQPQQRHPSLYDVPCPRCGAEAGQGCTHRDTGAPRMPHLQRIDAAYRE